MIIRISLVTALLSSGLLACLGAERKLQEPSFTVRTPLGSEVLLPVELNGQEGLSTLFQFKLDLAAASEQSIPFDALLGQDILISLSLPGGPMRYFSGICSRISQGDRQRGLTIYQVEI